MGVKITRRDLGVDFIARKMRALGQLRLTVGVQGKRGLRIYPSGANAASVALYNEYGTKDIPARSFIRGALFAFKSEIEAFIANEMERYIAGRSADAASSLARIGKFVAGKVKHRINTTSHWARPNAPSTVASKGFDRPLHETDLLSKSISWAVRTPEGSIIAEGTA